MANVRCYRPAGKIRKEEPLQGTLREFDYFAVPFGFPDSSTICGGANCCRDGYVWLTKSEYDDIQSTLQNNQNAIIIVRLSVANSKIRIDPQSIKSAAAIPVSSSCSRQANPQNPSQSRQGDIIPYS